MEFGEALVVFIVGIAIGLMVGIINESDSERTYSVKIKPIQTITIVDGVVQDTLLTYP
jgi:hypothetical protein